jgi:outer membrane protein, heavy metal efflux system
MFLVLVAATLVSAGLIAHGPHSDSPSSPSPLFQVARTAAAAAAAAAQTASAPAPAAPLAPAPATGTLTLADVMTRARERSPLVHAARERQRASGAARRVVALAPNPFVELRGENMGPTSRDHLPRDVFATVSQPIELGGKRAARLADADAAAQEAAAAVTSSEWDLASEVADVYIAALRARDGRATLVEQRRGVAELVTMLAQRVREGVSPEADLRKFETEVTRLASQITRADIALRSSLLRLSAIVGASIAAEQLAVPPRLDASVAMASTQAGSDVTEADIAKRPDVHAATARLARAESLARIERSRGVPDVTVTGGYKRTSGFDTAVAGVTIPLGIFDRNRVAIARAQGDVSAARLELQLVREQALADARARWTAARELGEQASRSERDLLEAAGVVRTAARAAFAEGRGDVLQLVDAERVFGEAAREALELRLDATLALIQARLARGEAPLP